MSKTFKDLKKHNIKSLNKKNNGLKDIGNGMSNKDAPAKYGYKSKIRKSSKKIWNNYFREINFAGIKFRGSTNLQNLDISG